MADSSATRIRRGEYTVLARRYRPQQFDEVVGQEAIAQALKGAIEANRVGHAYLFAGPRGVGKTTMARILAKALNCVNGPTTRPCDQCDSCRAIATGDDIDVLEIDGASNRGIDEVRELRQNAYYRPQRSRFKIYIIDEVHMLTREAFNALLKILEEPPAHVKFIFATTDPQKIPPTILSRCQRFDFSGIPPDVMQRKLEEILRAEGVDYEPEALHAVIRRAAGSMRDALSLLDQVLSVAGDRLTSDQVHRLLGTVADERLAEVVDAVISGDGAHLLELLEELFVSGARIEEVIGQLVEYLRDLAAIAVTGGSAPLVYVAPSLLDRLKQQANRWSLDLILAATDVLIEARGRLRTSQLGRTVAELALLRLCRLRELLNVDELLGELHAGEPPRPSRSAPDSSAPTSASGAGSSAAGRPASAPASSTTASKKNSSVTDEKGVAASVVSSAEDLQKLLENELTPISLARLAEARVLNTGSTLRVQLPASLFTPQRARELETLIQSRLEAGTTVRVELTDDVEPRVSPQQELRQRASSDRYIQELVDTFQARILRVEANGPTTKSSTQED